jgi:holo-[acyl-carrier protein] synthase
MEHELRQSVEVVARAGNYAIGNDLVFVPGFNDSLNDLFIKKVYTTGEQDYCNKFSDSLLRYASTWAAKEAVYKALKQLDDLTLGWKMIEISRKRAAGQPLVILHDYPRNYQISLTISHDGDYAWAVALIDTHINRHDR